MFCKIVCYLFFKSITLFYSSIYGFKVILLLGLDHPNVFNPFKSNKIYFL